MKRFCFICIDNWAIITNLFPFVKLNLKSLPVSLSMTRLVAVINRTILVMLEEQRGIKIVMSMGRTMHFPFHHIILMKKQSSIWMEMSIGYELELPQKRKALHLLILVLHVTHAIFGIIPFVLNLTRSVQLKIIGFSRGAKQVGCLQYLLLPNFTRK